MNRKHGAKGAVYRHRNDVGVYLNMGAYNALIPHGPITHSDIPALPSLCHTDCDQSEQENQEGKVSN
jgi:hypothetical protein